MNILRVLCIGSLSLLGALLAGCVSHPRGWSSKVAIERIVHENIAIGSSKETAEAFLEKAGVKWIEFPTIAKIGRPNTLAALVDTNFTWPVTTRVRINFSIGEDQKVEAIQITESYIGL